MIIDLPVKLDRSCQPAKRRYELVFHPSRVRVFSCLNLIRANHHKQSQLHMQTPLLDLMNSKPMVNSVLEEPE